MASEFSSLSGGARSVQELIDLVEKGRVRIPHFQRDFRWQYEDVRRLLDSMVKDWPIGSLLLWQRPAPKADITLGVRRIQAPQTESALWVVDGQQRITSLVNVLSEEGYADKRFMVDYHLGEQEFVRGREDRDDLAIPVWVLFDLRRVLAWFNQRPDLADWITRANDVTTKLRQYPIPVTVVPDADESVLRDIFDRLNNYGKRLTRAEVFAALNPPDQKGAGLSAKRLAENVDAETGFGPVDEDTTLRVILSRRGSDVTRQIRSEFTGEPATSSEFPAESRDEAFRHAETALLNAVRFIQDEAGVPHVSFLPYRYLLVVLARFFGHFPKPHDRNLLLLRRWFWRAAVLGPEIFKGSATGAMRALNNRVVPGDESGSVQGLLAAVERAPFARPDGHRFRTNDASTRLILAALWNQGPRSWETGEPIPRESLGAALTGQSSAALITPDIVRRERLSRELRTWAGNRLLAPTVDGVDVREALTSGAPQHMDNVTYQAVLASYAVTTEDLAVLDFGDVDNFVRRRTYRIAELTWSFLSSVAEYDFDDSPPLDSLFDEGNDDPGDDRTLFDELAP